MRKNFESTKCPRKKFGIHQIPTRKNFGPTNYPQKHGGAMTLDPRGEQWHAIKLKKMSVRKGQICINHANHTLRL